MIDEQRLRMMKPTGILINTARGGIVDESALYKALTQDWIAGAGLDAHATEPPRFRPLVELDNVVSTCHIAGVSDGASYRMAMQTVEKIITYFNGQMPANALTTAATLAGKSL
jgi:phosphoglycerate dehydrogenase-like enzyme